MENSNKNAELKISVNCLISVAALFALYGIASRLIPDGAQIYNSDFWGIVTLLVWALAISAGWIAIYWFLDRLQREPVKAVAITFVGSICFYIVCQTLFAWITGTNSIAPIQNVVIPLVSFYCVFSFYTVRLKSFDELVDSFIYGAFAGVGIGFASCMMEFVAYDSMSLKFVILTLVTRISVYAAIFALAGFLLHQSLLRHSGLRRFVAIAVMFGLLVLDVFVEDVFSKNIHYANVQLIPVFISFCFVCLQALAVGILIYRTIKKEENSTLGVLVGTPYDAPKKSVAALAALAVLCALFVRGALFATTKFSADDDKYNFRLPVDYERRVEASEGSIFDLGEAAGNEYFSNGTENVYLYFDIDRAKIQSLGDPAYYLYNWGVLEEKHAYASQENGETNVVFQTAFLLRKGKRCFIVDVYSSVQDDSAARNAVRMIAKTLEVNND